MLGQLNMEGLTKTEVAIKRLQTFEPPEGYYLAFSGGKDSCVVKALADMAGVRYDVHYSHTSVDPPELIYFIRENHPDVIFDYPRYPDGTRVTMWNLIPKKKMPPTRIIRLKLIKGNPELPVIPMVSNEVCGDDSGYWEGEWGSACIDEFLHCPMWNYIAFKSDDDVYDTLERYLRPDEFERLPQSEEECREIYNDLPWKKAIIVKIEAIIEVDE